MLHKGRTTEAMDEYARGAGLLAGSGLETSFLVNLFGQSMRIAANENSADLIADVIERVFQGTASTTGPGETVTGDPLTRIRNSLPAMVGGLPPEALISTLAACFAGILAGFPRVISRAMLLQTLDSLAQMSTVSGDRRATAVVGILLASDLRTLSLGDLAKVAGDLCATLPGVHFKPHLDGAAHWTLRLVFADDVICTITQLDDTSVVGAIAGMVALLLYGLAAQIRDTVLGSETLPRREVHLAFVSHELYIERIKPPTSREGEELGGTFVVSESTDLRRPEQPPILVICRQDCGASWSPGLVPFSDVHLIFGQVLEVMTMHLFAREVERASVRPKLIALLKKTTLAPGRLAKRADPPDGG